MEKESIYQRNKRLVDEDLNTFLENLFVKHEDVMEDLLAHTKTMPEKKMLISPLQGQFLQWTIQASKVKSVLEIGTYTGYSALMMAASLPKDGQLITIDHNPEWTKLAQKFWDKSPHGKKIILDFGSALDKLETYKGRTFDLIFLDADKKRYPTYVDLCLELLSENGLLIVDNVLWRGDVARPKASHMGDFLKEFNEDMAARTDIITTIVPIGDGMMLIKKAGSGGGT